MTWQVAEVMPHDVEKLLTDHLDAFLLTRTETYVEGLKVSGSRLPAGTGPDDRVAQVRRNGGQIRGLFDTALISIRVYAETTDVAGDIARLLVGALLLTPRDVDPVVAVPRVSGPSPVPEGSQPQQLVTAELRVRCAPL